MSKTALITGISGQDGAYLARLLLSKGYKVYGLIRRSIAKNLESLEGIQSDIEFIESDLLDYSSVRYCLVKSKPDEIYNLAAQSVVTYSWEQPLITLETNGMGPLRLLEAIRLEAPQTKFFQASSSEMIGIGNSLSDPLAAEFYPLSPYAASKLLGYHMTRLYRERYGIFATSGILFNHESPYRDPVFVSRKITLAVAKIYLGKQKQLSMGNLNVIRDWGFAGDYMFAAWKMLQSSTAKDYIIATGLGHTVEDLLKVAFECVGLSYKDYVSVDKTFLRPMEAPKVLGNPNKTFEDLNWRPEVSFSQLIEMMVKKDIERVKAGTI